MYYYNGEASHTWGNVWVILLTSCLIMIYAQSDQQQEGTFNGQAIWLPLYNNEIVKSEYKIFHARL